MPHLNTGKLTILTLAMLAVGMLPIGAAQPPSERSVDAYDWKLPPWASPPVDPQGNPTTSTKVELGRRLFYDGRLAADGMRSCASCHQQERSFSDAAPFSWGVTGELTARNTMGLANVGYATSLTWINPNMRALELQARSPMLGTHPVEMGMAGRTDLLISNLRSDPFYSDMFSRAFPAANGKITVDLVTAALAAFERTLISMEAPYDQYRHGGAENAISESAKRGEALFFSDRLKCHACHGGPLFNGDTDSAGASVLNFQNNGLYNVDGKGAYPAVNRGLIDLTARAEDMGRFKVPSLRNVAVTAPYMHDGSLPDLDAVLDHYAAGGRLIPKGESNAGDGRDSPTKSPLVRGFNLSPQEREDLKAFLGSLTDETFLTNPDFSNPWK
jgi:cytochrome c peroxidase